MSVSNVLTFFVSHVLCEIFLLGIDSMELRSLSVFVFGVVLEDLGVNNSEYTDKESLAQRITYKYL